MTRRAWELLLGTAALATTVQLVSPPLHLGTTAVLRGPTVSVVWNCTRSAHLAPTRYNHDLKKKAKKKKKQVTVA